MKCTTLKSVKLTDVLNPECINSIVCIRRHYSYSLAITLKSSAFCWKDYPILKEYNGRVIFISLSPYTYHLPYYMALPKELYSAVRLKEMENDEGTRFLKASITKPVII